MENREIVPLQLRHQMWLAAGVLITPWLLAVFLCWPIFRLHPVIIVGHLPGLAVAVYLHAQLSRHLASNHRYG
jgi:hypothetical protein